MSNKISSEDWVGSRGGKWVAHLARMEAMLASIDPPLIQALALEAPARIAEIGCGGGGTTLAIKRLAPTGSEVHGFDISTALIQSAAARVQPNDQGLHFEVKDMATAPAPETPYDRLVSRFGVMFFEDPTAAFGNLLPWLVPGGRFAFAVWGPLDNNPWVTLVRDVVAQVVEIPKPEPDAPGPFRYAEADTFLKLLDNIGFSDLKVQPCRRVLPLGGGLPPDEAARFALAAFATFDELLNKAGESARTQAEKDLTAAFSKYDRGGTVQLDAHAHIVTGTRP